MKNILLILIAISASLFLSPGIAFGQSNNTEIVTNLDNTYGGLSPESVDLANSNATNEVVNSTSSQNVSGGLSTESVNESM